MTTSIPLTEGTSLKVFEKAVEGDMDKHIKHFEKELIKIRTGRAHPSLIEGLKVEAYGSLMNLRDVAAISAPDVNMIVVQPWDKALINDIEKAIGSSDLGVSPQNDGNIIRVVLPKMSSARRDELIKVLSKKLEECKVAIRNSRKDIQNLIRDAEKAKTLSEDYSKSLQDTLQKTTDKMIELSNSLATKKEDELKSI